jgi:hypothetical protein
VVHAKGRGVFSKCEMDVRPGGIFSIDIATGRRSGHYQSWLFRGSRSDGAARLGIDIVSRLSSGRLRRHSDYGVIMMEYVGTGMRYVFTALHRGEADCEKDKASGMAARNRYRPRPVGGPREVDEVAEGDLRRWSFGSDNASKCSQIRSATTCRQNGHRLACGRIASPHSGHGTRPSGRVSGTPAACRRSFRRWSWPRRT